ncbi:bacteriocin-protection, YdeI or OmpD-associated domain-containing protein [Trichoderma gracile]
MSNRRVTRSALAKAAAKTSSSSSPSISSTSATNLATTSKSKSTTSLSSSSSTTVVKSKLNSKSKTPSPSTVPSIASDQSIRFPSASAFDQYLLQSGPSTPSGIWLRITKKSSISRFPSVTYHEAVDIALCHGWIDGQRKSLDSTSFLQRFTPRRPRSLWSRRNVERVELLTAEGRMRPAGVAAVEAAKEDGRWERAYAGPATMEVPGDFEDALAGNEAAKAAFQGLSKAQRYSFLWRIQTAVKRETRELKIRESIDLLAEGKTL